MPDDARHCCRFMSVYRALWSLWSDRWLIDGDDRWQMLVYDPCIYFYTIWCEITITIVEHHRSYTINKHHKHHRTTPYIRWCSLMHSRRWFLDDFCSCSHVLILILISSSSIFNKHLVSGRPSLFGIKLDAAAVERRTQTTDLLNGPQHLLWQTSVGRSDQSIRSGHCRLMRSRSHGDVLWCCWCWWGLILLSYSHLVLIWCGNRLEQLTTSVDSWHCRWLDIDGLDVDQFYLPTSWTISLILKIHWTDDIFVGLMIIE